MLTVDILTQGLDGHILHSCIRHNGLSKAKGILFLEPDRAVDDEQIYIGRLSDVHSELLQQEGCTFLLCAEKNADGSAPPVFDRNAVNANVIIVSMDILKLHNHISTNLQQYRQWMDDLSSTDDLQRLTEFASKKTGCTIAMLSSFFHKVSLCAASEEDRAFFTRLLPDQTLAYDTAQHVLTTEKSMLGQLHITLEIEGKTFNDHQIKNDYKTIARVVVLQPEGGVSPLANAYINDFYNTVAPIVLTTDSFKQLSKNAVSSLIADLVELKVTDADELQKRISLSPGMVQGRYYHPIVLVFSNQTSNVPYNYISGQLERIFPNCSVAAYNFHLTVIAAKNSFDEELQYDRDRLEDLLRSFDAYAGVGSCTRYLTSLRPLYLQAVATTRLGKFFGAKKERIFYYQDFSQYFLIDLCIESAVKLHQLGNMAYLCQPGLIGILRYDKKYGTQLRQTLKTYLESNCNATLCAKEMSVHRNTINYRIGVIEDLLGGNLSDAKLRLHLELSFLVLEYEENYLGSDPLSLIGRPPQSSDIPVFRSLTEKQ